MLDENLISSIFKRQAELGRERIRLLKYIPPWCYDRNKELEILCRLERDRNPELRTKVMLGHKDLQISIKKRGESSYRRVSVEYFGKLPGFNFIQPSNLSPSSPEGRRRHSSEEEEQERGRKRNNRSDTNSPTCPKASRPRIEDVSHDDACDGF